MKNKRIRKRDKKKYKIAKFIFKNVSKYNFNHNAKQLIESTFIFIFFKKIKNFKILKYFNVLILKINF